MLEIHQQRSAGLVTVQINGRVDSMTAQEVQQYLDNLTATGERKIVIDFTQISYISSAGLRILLLFQKQLKKVDGEIILCNLSAGIVDVFRMSGFINVFRILNSLDELSAGQRPPESDATLKTTTVDGVALEYISTLAEPGRLTVIGSQQKMAASEYGPEDVSTVMAGDLQFGLGLAALGDDYESTKNLFGEALIVNSHLFYYPAVKRPVVDYMLVNSENSSLKYKFFFGLNFSGSFNRVVAFDCKEGYVELNKLTSIINDLSPANVTGVVLIGESKGLLGMFLKKVPIIENKPTNSLGIYNRENFPDWIDFPVELTDFNKTVIGCGLTIRDKKDVPETIAHLLPDQSGCHLHAAVFEKGPLNKKAVNFRQELNRITGESEVHKVMHILDGSRFSSGLIGLIEIAL
ncbi:MAG: STAS domain-containing protein [Candidatus Neomarinimicrobiota bacterium]